MLNYLSHNIIFEVLAISYIAYQAIKVVVNRVKEEKEWNRKVAEAREAIANLKWEC